MRHEIKPLGYVRYGDDFILFMQTKEDATNVQKASTKWLLDVLGLKVHSKNNIVIKASRGLQFLGHQIYPSSGISIDKSMTIRLTQKIDRRNVGSYKAMHLSTKQAKQIPWLLKD